MNKNSTRLADQYLAALQTHLAQGPGANLTTAEALGRQAIRGGLETLDLVEIHALALVALMARGLDSETATGWSSRPGVFSDRPFCHS